MEISKEGKWIDERECGVEAGERENRVMRASIGGEDEDDFIVGVGWLAHKKERPLHIFS